VALMANMATALIRHGRIETTLAKAKALRPFVERLITLAKRAQSLPKDKALHLRRQALARLRDKKMVEFLFAERVQQFLNRPGGYTRIYKLGQRRGDAAEMALIAFLDADDEGYDKRRGVKKSASTENAALTEAPSEASDTVVEEASQSEVANADGAAESVVSDSSETPVSEVAPTEAAAETEVQEEPSPEATENPKS
jgi:large subunit ribosomal protein L17